MFSLVVVLALCTTQVLSEDQLGRAIRVGPMLRKSLRELEEGSIRDVEPLVQVIKTISAKQDDDCVLYGNKTCLFRLQKVTETTTQRATPALRTPRHTENFPDVQTAKTFLKDKLLALVQKSYPTIRRMIEGFYSPSTDSLLAKDDNDTKL